MYNYITWKFLDPNFVPGQYLGPAIDVGSTITAKILRKTGEVVPHSTICPLTMEETKNTELK